MFRWPNSRDAFGFLFLLTLFLAFRIWSDLFATSVIITRATFNIRWINPIPRFRIYQNVYKRFTSVAAFVIGFFRCGIHRIRAIFRKVNENEWEFLHIFRNCPFRLLLALVSSRTHLPSYVRVNQNASPVCEDWWARFNERFQLTRHSHTFLVPSGLPGSARGTHILTACLPRVELIPPGSGSQSPISKFDSLR